jgi:hypothetical protein
MEQSNEINESNETNESNEINESNATNESIQNDIICPTCNKQQLTIINVKICEAGNSIWNKCSVTQKCPLFQIKNKIK